MRTQLKKLCGMIFICACFALFSFSVINPAHAADSRFVVQDDGSVQDTRTGLVWAPQDNGADITWTEALSYCRNYSLGKHQDWRMPTVEELATLYGASKKNKDEQDKHTVDLATENIRITAPWVWSDRRTPDRKALVFGFNYGNVRRFFRGRGINRRALPVRRAP